MKIEELDYRLPEGRIATTPAEPRDSARLMVIDRKTGGIQHRHVRDLPWLGIVGPGDLMIFNQTRVLQAWFQGVRASTGGKISGLYLESTPGGEWRVMLESRGTLLVGERVNLDENAWLELTDKETGGQWRAKLFAAEETVALLERLGATPVPPYIRKERKNQAMQEVTPDDRERYNTVYARSSGSVAAPTAGLHFTPALLGEIDAMRVRRAMLTLHVGMGTFAPIRSETVEGHEIHKEWVNVPATTIGAAKETRARGGKILVVGTTSVRGIESLPVDWEKYAGEEEGFSTSTSLFITEGFEFRFTDALMTNFHLPRSTLLALVAAMPGVGIARLKEWYAVAIAEGYRFYSYGDAMVIV